MNTLLMDFNLPEILDPLLNLNPFSRIMTRMIYVSFVGLGMRNLKLLDSLHCHQDQAQNAHCISVDCDTGTVYCATDRELLGIDPRTGEVSLHCHQDQAQNTHCVSVDCDTGTIYCATDRELLGIDPRTGEVSLHCHQDQAQNTRCVNVDWDCLLCYGQGTTGD